MRIIWPLVQLCFMSVGRILISIFVYLHTNITADTLLQFVVAESSSEAVTNPWQERWKRNYWSENSQPISFQYPAAVQRWISTVAPFVCEGTWPVVTKASHFERLSPKLPLYIHALSCYTTTKRGKPSEKFNLDLIQNLSPVKIVLFTTASHSWVSPRQCNRADKFLPSVCNQTLQSSVELGMTCQGLNTGTLHTDTENKKPNWAGGIKTWGHIWNTKHVLL